MRDAIGGSFIIKLFLVFLATYIIFIGIALNFARAFRVKNNLIDIIEQNEGINNMDYVNVDNGVIGKIEARLRSVGYNLTGKVQAVDCKLAFNIPVNETDENLHFYNRGYCIRPSGVMPIDEDIDAEYYQVATFVDIYIPLLELHYLIPEKGETRKIERIK